MNLSKTYIFLQLILNLTIGIYINLVPKHYLQFAIIFFMISALSFLVQGSVGTRTVSDYLKKSHYNVYQKNKGTRQYLNSDLVAIRLFSITKSELQEIKEAKIISLIKLLRISYTLFFVSIVAAFFLLVYFVYH